MTKIFKKKIEPKPTQCNKLTFFIYNLVAASKMGANLKIYLFWSKFFFLNWMSNLIQKKKTVSTTIVTFLNMLKRKLSFYSEAIFKNIYFWKEGSINKDVMSDIIEGTNNTKITSTAKPKPKKMWSKVSLFLVLLLLVYYNVPILE